MRVFWTTLLALAATPGVAFCQSGVRESETRVKAEAGKDTRLMVVYNLRPNCTPGPLNMPRVATEPAHGRVQVRRASLKTNVGGRCPPLEIPVLLVLYRAAAAFDGEDSVRLELQQEGGTVLTRIFRIVVRSSNNSI